MADYEFDNTQGDYINCNADMDDLFDDNDNSAFPPEVLDYQDMDMAKEPLITVDKARFNIFKQYKNEYKLTRGMISKLHSAFEGGDQRSKLFSAPAWGRLLHLPGIPRPS